MFCTSPTLGHSRAITDYYPFLIMYFIKREANQEIVNLSLESEKKLELPTLLRTNQSLLRINSYCSTIQNKTQE